MTDKRISRVNVITTDEQDLGNNRDDYGNSDQGEWVEVEFTDTLLLIAVEDHHKTERTEYVYPLHRVHKVIIHG